MRALRTPGALRRDVEGVSAVEFAVVAPFMILLLFGGYTTTQAVAVSRKVTLTTRALADLTSQYAAMSSTDMTTVKNAATQIIAPNSSTPLGITISQIKIVSVNGATVSKIDWSSSQGSNAPQHSAGDTVTLPSGMPNSVGLYYILAEAAYAYQPPFYSAANAAWYFNSTINLSDRIFMLPRVSASVTYSGS